MREKKGVRMISKKYKNTEKSYYLHPTNPASNKPRIQRTSETHYNSIIDRYMYLFGIPTYDLYQPYRNSRIKEK